MPPDVREWLPENHLAWFVLAAVEEMDLYPFYAAYRVDGKSGPAYEPAMMVALLLYAYARGVRSSRVMERGCVEDVAFRVLAAQQRPDHATIARFIERHEAALAGLFGEVLFSARARAGERRGHRDRRHQGPGRREPRRERRLRAVGARILEEARRLTRPRIALRRSPRRRAARGAVERAGPARVAARSQAAPGGRTRPLAAAGGALTAQARQGGQAPLGRGAVDRVPGQQASSATEPDA